MNQYNTIVEWKAYKVLIKPIGKKKLRSVQKQAEKKEANIPLDKLNHSRIRTTYDTDHKM